MVKCKKPYVPTDRDSNLVPGLGQEGPYKIENLLEGEEINLYYSLYLVATSLRGRAVETLSLDVRTSNNPSRVPW